MHLETVGRYRLDEPLGSGGMAVVYRGYDDELERPVAVKLLADNLAADERFRRRFLREARLAAGLGHPNIVQVYDAGEHERRPYIVMEHVEGETVAELLAREGRLAPAPAAELAAQVAAGLAHAHAHGLIHRDVKPQNLLVERTGNVKIADFGIARSSTDTRLTEAGTILGTAAYLAPEQAAGAKVSPATDVYALGVVLYELLAGRTPYDLKSLQRLLAGGDELICPLRELVDGVPFELEQLVMRCLARVPRYRPAAAELAVALPALGRGSVTATAPTVPLVARPAGSPRLGRLQRALVVAGCVFVAIGAGAATLAFGDGPADVEPVPVRELTPRDQAEELSSWIRENTRAQR